MRDDTLLRMRATDAGFDRALPSQGTWLVFAGAGNLATLWLGGDGLNHSVAAAPVDLVREIVGIPGVSPHSEALPVGAAGGWTCRGDQALDTLCRRIAVLGHVLPDQPLRQLDREVEATLITEGGPRTTERLVEVRQRVGQNLFRGALFRYWEGKCALTGVSEPILLRASHAKPWKDCTDAERLDVHNGLLLATHLDAAFDAGLITVTLEGQVVPSLHLGDVERRVLALGQLRAIEWRQGHHPYFAWHRERVFRA